mmetsp:Transcript_30412/g.52741  ORF Transcript_30412/g.52741 Transcript_30412/m.52741 type:complete len:225 (-) Transcript_30412:284-958(-)|eukprot:CAMPEP_0194566676 /NCGR_PEP_ID=MMETSP0292-20121207/5462_1 /TAXON_ID=39354 /ORGANISM="Heterosigma akashiwo, Strain CCMP2393" /LENGTH=224 /DNA_ID=CAMNT_0039416305 /DNA_START=1 /DNA_END=675 /DNA_ORIENTATION=-
MTRSDWVLAVEGEEKGRLPRREIDSHAKPEQVESTSGTVSSREEFSWLVKQWKLTEQGSNPHSLSAYGKKVKKHLTLQLRETHSSSQIQQLVRTAKKVPDRKIHKIKNKKAISETWVGGSLIPPTIICDQELSNFEPKERNMFVPGMRNLARLQKEGEKQGHKKKGRTEKARTFAENETDRSQKKKKGSGNKKKKQKKKSPTVQRHSHPSNPLEVSLKDLIVSH